MKLDEWRPSETYFYDYIDLSDNEIKGSPVQLLNQTEFLAGFWASFNRIRFPMERLKIPELLQSLDLSRNLIHGTLPKNISGLQQLNVSHNHLCGPIPPTNFSASAFVGNDCLCVLHCHPAKSELACTPACVRSFLFPYI
ncbi:unnamed protein product [Thlaspi arvense]|uniref:Uncharacterized protein n=1 Tax=Thlaspi arvense TaxID=13288 RepID=A0AAU9T7N4_THLAR|nr:unnamed protein product [Thlaspi arvense]